jgi:hypothetical protein
MQLRQLSFLLSLSAVLSAPFGCGKDSDNDNAAGTAGTSASGGDGAANGGTTRGGTAPTSGTGPTGCEGISPETGAVCDDPGIVCPSDLGSCVCQRQSRTWQCFEIGGNEGGAGPTDQGGAGPEMGGVSGVAGEGGAAVGGAPAAGQSAGGAAAAAGASGAGAGGDG